LLVPPRRRSPARSFRNPWLLLQSWSCNVWLRVKLQEQSEKRNQKLREPQSNPKIGGISTTTAAAHTAKIGRKLVCQRSTRWNVSRFEMNLDDSHAVPARLTSSTTLRPSVAARLGVKPRSP